MIRLEASWAVPIVVCALAMFDTEARPLLAQGAASSKSTVDLAVSFSVQRSLELNSNQNFWADGGAMELGANARHGIGIALNVSGVHTGTIGSSGIPLSLVTETVGPRYRWHDGARLSLYGEGLVGEAHGFHSLFPTPSGAQPDALSFASRLGGGVDVRIGRHLAARVVEAAWLRTQLPNSSSDVQNNLQLATGVVFRFGTTR